MKSFYTNFVLDQIKQKDFGMNSIYLDGNTKKAGILAFYFLRENSFAVKPEDDEFTKRAKLLAKNAISSDILGKVSEPLH
tara:strand:- start:410 stop:649 length:240 start_codon:yes stop_codon:yes gene_type:complete